MYKCQNNNKRHSRKMLASNGLKSKLLGKLVSNFKNFLKILHLFLFSVIGGGITSAVTSALISEKSQNVELTIWDKAKGAGGRMSTSR